MKPPVHDVAWPAEVQALYRHDMREIWDRSIAPQIWNQYHNQLDLYLGLAAGAPRRILDVGCAQGTLALLLAERGHDVTAVDLRAEFLAYAQSRHTHGTIRFVAANVVEDAIPGQYDLVFANQIIEHLAHPIRLVARLREVLVPGGTLVMTTPNGLYVKNALPSHAALGDPTRWEHLQYSADADGHFFAFLPDELLALVRQAAFSDAAVRCFETPAISGHMKVRYLHRVVPAALLRAIDRGVLAVPWVGPRLSHQLMVTARR